MITIDALRKTGARPHFFGLGFIQIKVTANQRYHFYHPELMANVPEEELHDHRYDFTSRVIAGELINEIWGFREDDEGKDLMALVSCDPTKPLPEDAPVLRGRSGHVVTFATGAGCEYSINRDQFHRVRAERAVTYLERGPVVKDFARVIRREGAAEVCPFAVELSEAQCWEMMAELLGQEVNPGYHVSKIARGELGEISKIREELEEMEDAARQGMRIMEMIEASDLVGAMGAYLTRHHPGIRLDDLVKMSEVTQRAFRSGRRS